MNHFPDIQYFSSRNGRFITHSSHRYKYKYCCTIEDDYLKGKPTSSITTSKGTFVFHMRDWTVREDLFDENQIPIMEGTGKPQLMRRRHLVDIDFRDEMGWTALHMALIRGHEEIASYLLAKGKSCSSLNMMCEIITSLTSQEMTSHNIST